MPKKLTKRQILQRKNVVAAAKEMYHDEGELEIDDNAKVSRSEENEDRGAYVQAWIWVRDGEVYDYVGEPYEEE